MVRGRLVLYRKHSPCKEPRCHRMFISTGQWEIPAHLLASEKLSGGFFHVSLPPLISCPFLPLELPRACPVAVLQAWLANPKARRFRCFYFLSLVVPLPLMLLFPEADLALSCSLCRKRHPLSRPVPAAAVAARCFKGRQPSSHKGFFTRQGLCARRCSPGLFIPQPRSWFLAHSVFVADHSATCCERYLCQLVVLCFASPSAHHTELS